MRAFFLVFLQLKQLSLQEQGRRVTTDDGASPYEVVRLSPCSGYAELNRNPEYARPSDEKYQKLLKHDSDYVIPLDDHKESLHEKVEKKKSLPAYTGLDQTKRELDNNALYQKLRKT